MCNGMVWAQWFYLECVRIFLLLEKIWYKIFSLSSKWISQYTFNYTCTLCTIVAQKYFKEATVIYLSVQYIHRSCCSPSWPPPSPPLRTSLWSRLSASRLTRMIRAATSTPTSSTTDRRWDDINITTQKRLIHVAQYGDRWASGLSQ